MLLIKKDNNISDRFYLDPSKSRRGINCYSQCNHKICLKLKEKSLRNKSTHDVISREYKKVVLFLCDGYSVMNDSLVMQRKVTYGDYRKHIYSIITRATDSLKIITTDINIYNFLNKKLDELSRHKNE